MARGLHRVNGAGQLDTTTIDAVAHYSTASATFIAINGVGRDRLADCEEAPPSTPRAAVTVSSSGGDASSFRDVAQMSIPQQ
jgi:hypothetical protein